MSSTEVLQAVETIGESFKHARKQTEAEIAGLRERVELIEAQGSRPGRTASGVSREQSEYKGVFLEWVRKPRDKVYETRLTEAKHDLSKKDVSIGTGSSGGYALPEEISRAVENRERQLNPLRGIVRVDQCSSNDYKALVSMGDGSTGWSAETGTRSATTSPTLRERSPTFGEQYALPTASEWSLDDIYFNVEQWLVDEVAADWASEEASAIVSGNGSSRPTGILNTTPTTATDDGSPMRDAAAIQYVGLQSPGSPVTVNMDSLIHLAAQVKERYLIERDSVAWLMHRSTLAAIRKLKASTAGTYLWGDLAQDVPETLLGFRVFTTDAMPEIANDNFAVLFGNFKRGYLLADRVGMRITLDPYSTPGQVRFYVRRRVGGCVLNNDAIKALRIAD